MSNAMSSSQRAMVALGAIIASIAIISLLFWARLPIQDDPAYFNFADQRFFYGISNFCDVFSNIFFIYVSLFSLIFAFYSRHRIERRIFEPFILLNLAVFFTGWTSSYFHILSRPQDLIWDRLPMAVGFASVLTLVLVERVVFYYHRLILLLLNILAVWSVWNIDHINFDLRPYMLIQFGSCLAIAMILVFFRRGHVPRAYIWLALGFYITAKFCEINDHVIFNFTGDTVSGHTLKHLLACIGILVLNIGVLRSGKQQVGN